MGRRRRPNLAFTGRCDWDVAGTVLAFAVIGMYFFVREDRERWADSGSRDSMPPTNSVRDRISSFW